MNLINGIYCYVKKGNTPRKLIPYLIGRYGQYFSFQWIKQYRNTLKLYRSKYWSISDYAEHTSKYRPFQAKSKNRPVQKASLKKNKNKTKHKSTKWLTSPSDPTPLCWSLLTFRWLSLCLPSSVLSVHFPFSSFFSFFSSSYLLFRLQLHPLGPFVLCGSCNLILCVLTPHVQTLIFETSLKFQ